MKKIGLFLFAAVMSLLAVSCRDVLLEKNIGGFSVSFQTPGSSSRAGATATWKLEAWLELEGGAQLQKKNDTVPANAPITISFDAVPIGTKLKVQVRLEDSENQFIQHEGSSDWITVDAESKTVVVQVQRMIINAAAPTITTQPESQNRRPEAGSDATWTATLTVVATSPDGGNLSYQWYENTANSNSGGTLIPEATKVNYQVGLIPGETKYFYCEVTNTNDGVNGSPTATTISNVAELVYNIAQSGVLLWKRTDNGSLEVSIVPYGDYSVSAPVVLGAPYLPPSWCFDNAGNLYWYAEGENGAQCYNLQADKSYSSSGDYYSPPPFSALSYDNSANILYGIGDGTLKYWQKTGGGAHNILLDGGTGLFSISDLGFTVHNNIVYCATYAEKQEDDGPILGVVQLSSYKLEDASDGGSKTATPLLVDQTFTLPEVFGSNPPTSQMIYQEGALYLLLGRVEVSSSVPTEGDSERFSCGALVKINPSTLTIDTSFGNNGYLGLVSGRTISGTYNSRGYSMDLYSPTESNENSAFYGPVGFVAVMPKKLVIADAGYALSKGSNDELRALRKNRVVTVDLETPAFDVASLSDTTFYGNITTGCGFLVVE